MRFRFHKGDRVEVQSKREVPSGSWCYGIITSGNGHTYNIQYESYSTTNGTPIVERVPRKSIRPCPPMEPLSTWSPGDFVEVFDNASWKFAMVLKLKDKSSFLVRLLGTSEKVEAPKSCLRVPQSWQDEQWIPIETVDSEAPPKRGIKRSRDSPSEGSVGSSGTSNKEEMMDDKLALDAYYGVMESLRAFGYISWEQEEMITNLRMKLNITNDQHLMELRKLVSAR